jgi:hypothetical protein
LGSENASLRTKKIGMAQTNMARAQEIIWFASSPQSTLFPMHSLHYKWKDLVETLGQEAEIAISIRMLKTIAL